jgi:chemotaxis signal transduction protein
MTSPDPEDSSSSSKEIRNTATRVEEIRVLEDKLLGLKKDLLFSAATAENEEPTRALSFLLVRVGGNLFAAPILYVEEVVELPGLLPLSDAVATIAGLCNYHGRMLAVIDVAELTGGSRTAISTNRILVVCEIPPRAFALLVDEALEVIVASASAVTLADEVMTGVLRAAGVLHLEGNTTAQIIDLAWLAVGAQLAAVLREDAATPRTGDGE